MNTGYVAIILFAIVGALRKFKKHQIITFDYMAQPLATPGVTGRCMNQVFMRVSACFSIPKSQNRTRMDKGLRDSYSKVFE